MKPRMRKILLLCLLLLAILLVLDFGYFWHQTLFAYLGRKQVYYSPEYVHANRRGEPNTVFIDSVRIKAPIVYVEENSEEVFQRALQNGVVHYPGTALPGEYGNAYIFGHSSDLAWAKGSYKTVFALLPKVKVGEEIKITNRRGELFTYTVTQTFVAKPTDVYLLEQGDRKTKKLTLQTSYPLGTALKRWIVVAEMK